MASMRLTTTLLILPSLARAQNFDPGRNLAQCVDGGVDLNTCTERMVNSIRPIMSTGIPGLNPPLPPLDPMYVDKIAFNFAQVNMEFKDLNIEGLKEYQLRSSNVDKAAREWKLVMFIPRLEVKGRYKLTGELGIDLGVSEGPETFNATDTTIDGTGYLTSVGGKINVQKLDLKMKLGKVAIALDCLFPKDNGDCCPEKGFKNSCTPNLAKTIHRFINKDGQKFVQTFQPQISAKIGAIIKNLFNRGLQSLDASYMINV